MSRPLGALAVALALAAAAPTTVSAQASFGTGWEYQSYSFDPGLGAESASLMMLPVALRVPLGSKLRLDLYSAWAEGQASQDGNTFRLSGPVDTNVKASLQATPWALVSVSANLPTGNSSHSGEEAIVASVLSTDLLGFREATWGTGFAVTSSVATAATVGGFGVGVAGAYAMRGEFEPSEGDPLRYKPGSETRIRVGVDRNFGSSTLTLGGTIIDYSFDQADGRNLFQAGKRLRFDGSFAFRAGDGVWTFYAADVVRDNGDLFLDLSDGSGNIVGDTLVATAKQNMIVGGVMGTVGVGGGFVVRPHLDYRYQTREEEGGGDAGTGWVFAGGADVPLRLFGRTEFFPKARVFFGAIRSGEGEDVKLVGFELKGTLRWIF